MEIEAMKEYRLKFNFLIPILRATFLIVSISIIIFLLLIIVDKGIAQIMKDIPALLYFLFIIGLFSVIIYQMVKGLFNETLSIKITNDNIEIRNLILFKKDILTKNDVSGIYSSDKQFAKGTWKTVIINTANGKRFELVQFNYFDFKKIIDVLTYFGYKKGGTILKSTSIFGKKSEVIIE